MNKKKKTRKSKAAKSMRDLPRKQLNAKNAKGVKGGKYLPISFAKSGGYKPQKPTGLSADPEVVEQDGDLAVTCVCVDRVQSWLGVY
jgi:hypothetical protein